MGDWSHYIQSEFGLLQDVMYDDSLFGRTIAPNDYVIVQGESSVPVYENLGNILDWQPGEDIPRTPLMYFGRYDSNGNKIGYVGFDIEVVCDYTILGHRAQVSVTTTACVRDLNKAIVQDLGGRPVGTAADSDSYLGFVIDFYLSIGKATDGNTVAVGGVSQIYNPDKEARDQRGFLFAGVISSNINWQNIKYNDSDDEYSPTFGKKAKRKGGYVWRKTGRKPSFNNHSDTITVSSKPTVSPTSTGFFHQYFIHPSDLSHLADALFFSLAQVTDLVDAVGELVELIWSRNRVNCVLDMLVIPVTPTYGSAVAISAGGRKLTYNDGQGLMQEVNGYPVSDPFVDFPCGSITVPEYWANFLDFSGTKFKLFLPYVGYVDIQPEFINGGTIWVDYRFNTIDGSFMAYVHSTSTHSELTRSLIGQYAGMAAIHIPVQSTDYSNKISGLISAMGSVAAAAAGVTAPAAIGAAASLANTAVQKPGTTHGNGYNASSSYLSHRKPYLIVERQIAQFSELYPHEDGLPYYVNDTIGNCRGLTKATKAHLESIPAPASVKERIKELLAEGIIVNQLTT